MILGFSFGLGFVVGCGCLSGLGSCGWRVVVVGGFGYALLLPLGWV